MSIAVTHILFNVFQGPPGPPGLPGPQGQMGAIVSVLFLYLYNQ